MAQPVTALSPSLVLVPAELVQHLPGVEVRAQFTTDDEQTFLRLTRLVIEVTDIADEIAITAAVLHAVRLRSLRKGAEQILGMRDRYRRSAPPAYRPPGRPRDTWTERELARLAQRYAELVHDSEPIFPTLVKEWRTPAGETATMNALRTAVKETRRRGLLSETTPGCASGVLTAKGRRLLRSP